MDWLIILAIAWMLAFVAAFFSSNTVGLIPVLFLALFFSYYRHQWQTARVGVKSEVFITSCNGDLLLEQQSEPMLIGKLSGSQWCSRYMAVLRYSAAGRTGHLVVLNVRQRPEQFRQLSVWLRHNSRNEGRQET